MANYKYYNPAPLLAKKADYNITVGKRSNGKTYAFCSMALTSYINDGARMAYVRRYSEDIAKRNIENLFLPHPISELTEDNYNGTVFRANKFRLARFDEGKLSYVDDNVFCQTFALNTWERTKGADNGYFDYIVFDEFMTRGNYLPNEFVIFCNLLSSLLRDRAGTKIIMLANTVNKYCPYFAEMGIGDIFDNIKQGEIITRKYGDLKIAIEYAPDTNNTAKINKYFNFNNPQLEMIKTGKWEIKNYPHLTEHIGSDNVLFRFYVFFDRKIFCGDVIQYNNDIFINYHKCKDNEIKKDSLIYSDKPQTSPYHALTIYDGDLPPQRLVYDLINKGKCFYADNEIGEQVRNWINTQKKQKTLSSL